MKVQATGYTFVKGAANVGTITFTGTVIPTTLERILAIIDVTTGTTIYNPTDTTKLGAYASPVLTLAMDTTALANTDKLLVFVEDGKNVMTNAGITIVTQEFTRPSDTIAYSTKDVISNSTTSPSAKIFSSVVLNSGDGGEIIKARILTDSNAMTPRLRLNLFNAAPTQINDNAQRTILYANRASFIGYIDLPAMFTEGTGSDSSRALIDSISHAFKTSGSSNIWFEVETLDAFTPISAQKFFIELTILNY